MKLRLTAPGFEEYNGQMGVIMFENGLSTTDVLPVDAIRIAGVMGAEWEDGSAANVGQMYLNAMDTPAPALQEQRGKSEEVRESAHAQRHEKAEVKDVIVTAQPALYTREQLAAIADKDGIAGLRDIGAEFGVKGNSINGLIDGIMKAAGKEAE